MLTKQQANKLRGLVSHKVRRDRALWALNSDTMRGCNFEHLRAGILADKKAADEALFAFIRRHTEGYGAAKCCGVSEDLE